MSITVDVRNGNVEQAMRVLKRKVMKEGIVKELRERQSFEKPAAKGAVKLVDAEDIDTLIDLLHNEAKVI